LRKKAIAPTADAIKTILRDIHLWAKNILGALELPRRLLEFDLAISMHFP
jgi:hypothetical protein